MILISFMLLFTNLSINALHFNKTKTNYDEKTAKILLNMAAAAYGDLQQICLDKTLSSFHAHLVLSTSSEQCDLFGNTCESYIAASDSAKQLTVVFRGSKTTGQIVMQGLHYFVPADFFGMGHVNRYFKNGVHVLWQPIEKILKDAKYASFKIAFTGHSLGGALAAVAAARTVQEGLRKGHQVMVYTFGEPRVGDATFAANFDKLIPNSYRVVFRKDIVPHLPPCIKKTTYDKSKIIKQCDPSNPFSPYHHGTEIWYPDSMKQHSLYVECLGRPKGEDPMCSNRLFKSFGYKDYRKSEFDHRHYFTLQVPEFGKTGCTASYNDGKPDFWENL